MENLLNEIKQYRKEQCELHEWTKKNGHPITANYTEGGLDTCDKIIAIIERAVADSSHESSGLNKPVVSNNEGLEPREEVAVCPECKSKDIRPYRDHYCCYECGNYFRQTDC